MTKNIENRLREEELENDLEDLEMYENDTGELVIGKASEIRAMKIAEEYNSEDSGIVEFQPASDEEAIFEHYVGGGQKCLTQEQIEYDIRKGERSSEDVLHIIGEYIKGDTEKEKRLEQERDHTRVWTEIKEELWEELNPEIREDSEDLDEILRDCGIKWSLKDDIAKIKEETDEQYKDMITQGLMRAKARVEQQDDTRKRGQKERQKSMGFSHLLVKRKPPDLRAEKDYGMIAIKDIAFEEEEESTRETTRPPT